jgi:hypothetical protein
VNEDGDNYDPDVHKPTRVKHAIALKQSVVRVIEGRYESEHRWEEVLFCEEMYPYGVAYIREI